MVARPDIHPGVFLHLAAQEAIAIGSFFADDNGSLRKSGRHSISVQPGQFVAGSLSLGQVIPELRKDDCRSIDRIALDGGQRFIGPVEGEGRDPGLKINLGRDFEEVAGVRACHVGYAA